MAAKKADVIYTRSDGENAERGVPGSTKGKGRVRCVPGLRGDARRQRERECIYQTQWKKNDRKREIKKERVCITRGDVRRKKSRERECVCNNTRGDGRRQKEYTRDDVRKKAESTVADKCHPSCYHYKAGMIPLPIFARISLARGAMFSALCFTMCFPPAVRIALSHFFSPSVKHYNITY